MDRNRRRKELRAKVAAVEVVAVNIIAELQGKVKDSEYKMADVLAAYNYGNYGEGAGAEGREEAGAGREEEWTIER